MVYTITLRIEESAITSESVIKDFTEQFDELNESKDIVESKDFYDHKIVMNFPDGTRPTQEFSDYVLENSKVSFCINSYQTVSEIFEGIERQGGYCEY